MAQVRSEPPLEWAVAGAALEGVVSGDLHLVSVGPERALLAVLDGLGHGPEACRASHEAALLLETYASAPLLDLVRYCHDGLRGTRGVAMTLCAVDLERDALEWVAIGNVEGLVLREGSPRGRAHAAVVQRGGVVGYRLPPLRSGHVELVAGDLIVLATDGIRSGFADALDPLLDVQVLADVIAERFARASDDRLVLVARYAGRSG